MIDHEQVPTMAKQQSSRRTYYIVIIVTKRPTQPPFFLPWTLGLPGETTYLSLDVSAAIYAFD